MRAVCTQRCCSGRTAALAHGQGAMRFSISIQIWRRRKEDRLTGALLPCSDTLLLFEPSLPSQLGWLAMQRIPAGMLMQALGSRITHPSADQPWMMRSSPSLKRGLASSGTRGQPADLGDNSCG